MLRTRTKTRDRIAQPEVWPGRLHRVHVRTAGGGRHTGGRELFAVCAECEQADPTYIRRNGSFFRLLGFPVEDVRGLLK